MAEFKIVGAKNKMGYSLEVRGARLRNRNFSGRPTELNPKGGIRTVSIDIDNEELYNKLLDDGWRFYTFKDDDGNKVEPFTEYDGEVVIPKTALKISWRNMDGSLKEEWQQPKVKVHTPRNKAGNKLSESTVGELDGAYIVDSKMTINPSPWKTSTDSGVKGYINILHVTTEERDPFADEYDDDEEDIPFE